MRSSASTEYRTNIIYFNEIHDANVMKMASKRSTQKNLDEGLLHSSKRRGDKINSNGGPQGIQQAMTAIEI